jgi:hypothetical protein
MSLRRQLSQLHFTPSWIKFRLDYYDYIHRISILWKTDSSHLVPVYHYRQNPHGRRQSSFMETWIMQHASNVDGWAFWIPSSCRQEQKWAVENVVWPTMFAKLSGNGVKGLVSFAHEWYFTTNPILMLYTPHIEKLIIGCHWSCIERWYSLTTTPWPNNRRGNEFENPGDKENREGDY